MARHTAFDEAHKTHLTASMMATVCGFIPASWDSPYALWERLVGEAPPKDTTEQMMWGTLAEGAVAKLFTWKTGIKIARPRGRFDQRFWYVNEDDGIPAGALLDGRIEYYDDGVLTWGPFEGKTGSEYGADDWGTEPPLHYYGQVQWQLYCTRKKRAWIAGVLGNKLHLPDPVERDDETIALMVMKGQEFWQHVIDRTPPPMDGTAATTEAVKRRFSKVTPGLSVVIEDPEAERLCATHLAYKDSIDEMKAAREHVGNNLRGLLDDAEAAVIGPYKVTNREQVSTRFDLDAFRAAYPDLAAQFTKTTEPSRTLRVTKPKAK